METGVPKFEAFGLRKIAVELAPGQEPAQDCRVTVHGDAQAIAADSDAVVLSFGPEPADPADFGDVVRFGQLLDYLG